MTNTITNTAPMASPAVPIGTQKLVDRHISPLLILGWNNYSRGPMPPTSWVLGCQSIIQRERRLRKWRTARSGNEARKIKKITQMFAGGYGGASSSAAAAAASEAGNDGRVMNCSLPGSRYESSLGVVYFSLCLLTLNTVQ